MMLHPLDVPRPKERYESDLYDRTARRDNLAGLLLAIAGVIAIPSVLLLIAARGLGWL